MAGGSLDCLSFIFGPKKDELLGSLKPHHITRNVRSPPGGTYIENPTEIYEIDDTKTLHTLAMGLYFWDNYKFFALCAIELTDKKGECIAKLSAINAYVHSSRTLTVRTRERIVAAKVETNAWNIAVGVTFMLVSLS